MTENHSFGCYDDQMAMGLHDFGLGKSQVYQKPKDITEEEFKQRANDYLSDKTCDTDEYGCGFLPSSVEQMLVDFTQSQLTEKDKQIENAKEVFADNERLLFENAEEQVPLWVQL